VICLECSGIHRKLGMSVSKIRSLKLDNISDEVLEFFLANNTKQMNGMWEKNILSQSTSKPSFESSSEVKEKWIIDKYINHKFMDRQESKNFVELMCEAMDAGRLADIVGIVCLR